MEDHRIQPKIRFSNVWKEEDRSIKNEDSRWKEKEEEKTWKLRARYLFARSAKSRLRR